MLALSMCILQSLWCYLSSMAQIYEKNLPCKLAWFQLQYPIACHALPNMPSMPCTTQHALGTIRSNQNAQSIMYSPECSIQHALPSIHCSEWSTQHALPSKHQHALPCIHCPAYTSQYVLPRKCITQHTNPPRASLLYNSSIYVCKNLCRISHSFALFLSF